MLYHPIVIVKHPDSSGHDYDGALAAFTQKQICEGAVDALQHLEAHPAHIVIAEMDLPDMTGIEVAEAIRDIDTETGHFTYIVLVGGQMTDEVAAAYEHLIDHFVADAESHLIASSIHAGIRIADKVNALGTANAALMCEREQLLIGQLLDPVTGLGNRRYAENALNDAIRQIESRGGAVCFLMLQVHNLPQVIEEYDERIGAELINAISDRIKHLVRPMDTVTYFDTGVFGLVLLQPSIEHCTAECYQRIFDGVRLKSYQTSVGFLPTTLLMSICASHAEAGAPDPETMVKVAAAHLQESLTRDAIQVNHLTEQVDGQTSE